MDNANYVALSRLAVQNRNVEAIANNLANANTPGFKAGRLLFDEWIAKSAGSNRPGAREINFVQDRASFREHTPGSMTKTANPLDLAITGTGFFAIDTPRGERYTRSGQFTLSPDGRVTTSEGYAVLDTQNRPITVSPQDTRLTVSADGTLESENGPLGKIRVVDFDDLNRLRPEGQVLFASDTPPRTVDAPKMMQGMLEESNVRPLVEMTKMMGEVREFQFVTQFVDRESERQLNTIERLTRKRN